MRLVMLALSTHRRSPRAVERAFAEAAGGTLLFLHVVDINVRRYLVHSGIQMLPELAREAEQEILAENEQEALGFVAGIERRAADVGIPIETIRRTGRFGIVAVEVAQERHPALIVTCRTNRPAWVKKLFGSPVDHLVANAGCPVVEA